MNLYPIFIGPMVDDGEDKLVAIATTPEECQRKVAILKQLQELNESAWRKYNKVTRTHRDLVRESKEKFPLPPQEFAKVKEPHLPVVHLIAQRKEAATNGDLELANEILKEIKATEKANSEIKARNEGRVPEWFVACSKVEETRRAWVKEVMGFDLEYIESYNKLPYRISYIRFEVVESDAFLNSDSDVNLTQEYLDNLKVEVEK